MFTCRRPHFKEQKSLWHPKGRFTPVLRSWKRQTHQTKGSESTLASFSVTRSASRTLSAPLRAPMDLTNCLPSAADPPCSEASEMLNHGRKSARRFVKAIGARSAAVTISPLTPEGRGFRSEGSSEKEQMKTKTSSATANRGRLKEHKKQKRPAQC